MQDKLGYYSKAKAVESGIWLEGILYSQSSDKEKYFILPHDYNGNVSLTNANRVCPTTVSKSTGRDDRQKTPLYTGDIVRLWYKENSFLLGLSVRLEVRA